MEVSTAVSRSACCGGGADCVLEEVCSTVKLGGWLGMLGGWVGILGGWVGMLGCSRAGLSSGQVKMSSRIVLDIRAWYRAWYASMVAALSAALHEVGRLVTCSCISPIASKNSCVCGAPEARRGSNSCRLTCNVLVVSSSIDLWLATAKAFCSRRFGGGTSYTSAKLC